jgi:hypothetical protein
MIGRGPNLIDDEQIDVGALLILIAYQVLLLKLI